MQLAVPRWGVNRPLQRSDELGLVASIADIEQLSSFIQQNSIGRAVIVQGDFNQLYLRPVKRSRNSPRTTASPMPGSTGYNGLTPADAPTRL